MNDRIYLSSPHMCGKEMKYIVDAFKKNWIAPLGENVNEFENAMVKYVNRPYALALSSGSAAIHLGLKYLGVKKDDVVFCSSFTFSGSCNAIDYCKATPVFIDCDYETYNMGAVALRKAYEKYPNPAAIIIVNLYGNPADYDTLLAIAKEHNTPVLEDAAESLGATYKGKQTGNFGDISVLSFNGNKIITSSGGGMVLVSEKKIKDKLLFWATQSREPFPWYEHKEIGYNYRMSNISAGIGRGQMFCLKERVEQKKAIYNTYKECFKDNPYIDLIPDTKDSEPNHWLSAITLNRDCKCNFMDILNELQKYNIESRPAWKPMHLQPVFQGYDFFSSLEEGSISEDLFNRSLCLPSDTKMTKEQILFIADLINKIVYSKQK
ncbi:MAG: aminotransferase class I/II-fold pyridoxal phosphate-dependent enzyme [Clostridia bacterium]